MKKLRTKLLLILSFVLLIAFVPMAFFFNGQTETALKNELHQHLNEMSKNYAAEIKGELQTTMTTVKALASDIVASKNAGIANRDIQSQMLKDILINSEQCVTSWAIWDPNAFDGKDNEFTTPNNPSGRFLPWYIRNSDGTIEDLSDMENEADDVSDYYLLPKEKMAPVIIEPYTDTVDDAEVLMTSIVYPLIMNNEFLGVVGMDISLESISGIVNAIRPYDDGYARLISHGGLYVTHDDASLLMSGVKESQILGGIQNSESASFVSDDGKNYITLTPIMLDETDAPWMLEVVVPYEKALAPVRALQYLIIGLFAGTFILLCVVFSFVAGSISKSISLLAVAAGRLAAGDTNARVRITDKNEIGQLAASFEKMRSTIERLTQDMHMLSRAVQEERLDVSADPTAYEGQYRTLVEQMNGAIDAIKTLLGTLKESVADLAGSSSQITSGSLELAQGATEQAAAIEQIFANVTSLSEQTRINADRTVTANELASQVYLETRASSEKMERLVEAVENISDASRNVAKIIRSIDDIAFQTNLLALNAAVEAARAGNAGRGFAVVAEEVKNLATRSAASAKETTALIADSIERAADGVELVRATQETLIGIEKSINDAADIIAEIANSNIRQSEAISDVNSSIAQVSQVVQQTSASSQESAAASARMDQQAMRMQHALGRYKLAPGSSMDKAIECASEPLAIGASNPRDGAFNAEAQGKSGFGKY